MAGGGRYDGLVGMFLGKDIPSTGIAFGFERLVLLMTEQDMFKSLKPPVDVLVTVVSPDDRPDCTAIAQKLRAAGLKVDLYSEDKKVAKQIKHAVARAIPFAVLYGAQDRERQVVQVKRLLDSAQDEVPVADLVDHLTRLCHP